ncbi:MAG TPA: hypothetical protein VKU88_03230 [Acidimicrobiales bacterium]|nr:hypothetical protein [Acidimicrobiales bacterium]
MAEAVAAERRVRVRPLGASFVGLLALLVGIWAAIAVYVGPYFGYRPTSAAVWTWNTQNWLLHLAPGAAAGVAGLLLLAVGPARRMVLGGAITMPALLLLLAGGWLVVGPAAWPLIESGPAFNSATTSMGSFLYQIGTTLGPGVVLTMLGGMALKAGLARPVVEAVPEATAAPVSDPATGQVAPPASV